MQSSLSLNGPANNQSLAVVTGAAKGIGASFARLLYRAGYRLLLVDVDGDALKELRERLVEKASLENVSRIELYAADLTCRESVEALTTQLAQTPCVDLLINNAGVGSLTDFTDVGVEQHANMIALHVETPMRLIHAVLPQMKSRNSGAVINVASLGAFAPCAQAVQYASTKAYLVVFSEALQEELRDTGIRVQALCPGFVRTDFHASEAMKNFHQRQIPASLWTTPDEVAFASLRSLQRGPTVVIPGWRSRVLGLFMRMVLLKPIVRVATRPKPIRVSTAVQTTRLRPKRFA